MENQPADQSKPYESEDETKAIDKSSKHSGDRCKFTSVLPFIFVLVVVSTIYVVYTKYHLMPLLTQPLSCDTAIGNDAKIECEGNHFRGTMDGIIFNTLTLFLVVCYAKCILVHPGTMSSTP